MAAISQVFDTRRNALNAIRLVLAVGVIAWHSFPLTGTATNWPGAPVVGNLSVDGFFAISGFLITASWTHRPRVVAFLWARFLRIMPAFWVCLVVTAFLFAPLAGHYHLSNGLHYVAANWTLHLGTYAVGDTLASNPYPNVWDGSLWTLWWEALCYVGVLALGVIHLLRRREAVTVLFGLAVVASIAVAVHAPHNYYLHTAPRFAVMFLAGAVLHQWREKIPLSWPLVGLAAVVVVGSARLPDYRILAALPLAYVCIGVGSLCQRPSLHTDLSYGTYIYAFCVQQLLAVAGLWRLGPGPFFLLAVVCTLPVAAVSWFVVERPALRLKRLADRSHLQRREAAAVVDPQGVG